MGLVAIGSVPGIAPETHGSLSWNCAGNPWFTSTYHVPITSSFHVPDLWSCTMRTSAQYNYP